jgi:hypothetical protein
MGRSVPTSDIVAMCLVAADCDVSLSVGEVIRRVEQYEDRPDYLFALEPGEFRRAFVRLAIFELHLCDLTEVFEPEHGLLARIPIWDWITPILSFNDVWCNDEGEYWSPAAGFPEGSEWNYGERNRPMRELLAEPANFRCEAIADFLKRQQIDEGIFQRRI